MGGHGAWGFFVFQVSALVAAGCTFAAAIASRERLRLHAADGVAASLLTLIGFQLVPLPAGVVATLSPYQSELLPAWTAGSPFGEWSRLTLAPWQTARQLGLVASGLLLFVAIRHRLSRPGALPRLARFLGGLGIAVSGFALLQYFVGNGKYYWIYESPFLDTTNGVKGPFVNTNHFGGFAVLTLPAMLWLALTSHTETDASSPDLLRRIDLWRIIGFVGLVLLLLAIPLSFSRAALLGLVVASGAWMLLHRSGRLPIGTLVGGLLSVCLIAVLGLTLLGDRLETQVENNVQSLATTDLEKLDSGSSRRQIWEVTLQGAAKFPIFGAGLGAHPSLYPHFWRGPTHDLAYSHVECGPLQMLLEIGGLGLLLIVAAVGVVGWCGWRRLRAADPSERAVVAVFAAMLAAHLLHTMTDFVWHTPGCMVLVAAAAAALLANSRSVAAATRLHQVRPMAGLLAVAVVAAVALPGGVRQLNAREHWVGYLASDGIASEMVEMRLDRIRRAATADPTSPLILAHDARMLSEMFAKVQKDADRLELQTLRDAAINGGFGDAEAVAAWLRKDGVAGDAALLLTAARRQAQRSLRANPLDPELYVLLARTEFLESSGDAADGGVLFDQALVCGPDRPATHFELGRERMRQNRQEEAIAHWKTAFSLARGYQQMIATLLAPLLPAEDFIAIFEPDADALAVARTPYLLFGARGGTKAFTAELATHWIALAEESSAARAVGCYRKAFGYCEEIGDAERCELCARKAAEIAPFDFDCRKLLAQFLVGRQRYAEATEHLTWCAKQKPDNDALRKQAVLCEQAAATQRRERDQMRWQGAEPSSPDQSAGGVVPVGGQVGRSPFDAGSAVR